MHSDGDGQPHGCCKFPAKRRRSARACDYCHHRGIRCRVPDNETSCQNCQNFCQACTYHRQPRRRGAKPRARDEQAATKLGSASTAPRLFLPVPTTSLSRAGSETQRADGEPWTAPRVASQATIVDLVEIYFEIVYPVFPFFHQSSFLRRVSRAEYTTDKALFASTMALCALVSSRVRDGSVTNPRWDLCSLSSVNSDVYYNAASEQLIGQTACRLDILRAHAILSIAAIQNGRTRDMHQHLGSYHTLVAMDGLHDESNWPRNIGVIEREERRRLVMTAPALHLVFPG